MRYYARLSLAILASSILTITLIAGTNLSGPNIAHAADSTVMPDTPRLAGDADDDLPEEVLSAAEEAISKEDDADTVSTMASCSYQGCDLKGPSGTGCSADGYTLAERGLGAYLGQGIPAVELRWSRTCHAFWARGWGYSTYEVSPNYFDILIVKRNINTGAADVRSTARVYLNGNYHEWTVMAGQQSGYQTRACVSAAGSSWKCTSYYI